MTTPAATSRVFEAARLVKARLEAATWPAHPVTGTDPQVAFTDPDPDAEFEIVHVVPDVGDDSTITWQRMPAGRDEIFDIDIRISALDINDEDQMLDRLEALADVVQREFYDDVTGTIVPLGIAQAVKLEGIGQVAFVIVPAANDGLRGLCDLRYRLSFRI